MLIEGDILVVMSLVGSARGKMTHESKLTVERIRAGDLEIMTAYLIQQRYGVFVNTSESLRNQL